MPPWITVDDRIKCGLQILNQIENNKLRQLVNRVCQSLESSLDDTIFSTDEEEKLSSSLNLDQSGIKVLLHTFKTIYNSAAIHFVTPAAMESSMKDKLCIEDDKIAVLVNAWLTHSEKIIAAHKKKSIFPSQVSDVSWTIDVKAASTAIAREAKPVAKLQLELKGDENEFITVEMNKTQLSDLYEKLGDIQDQLERSK
ncbi:hypothetical protein QAD02_014724 [Eretmocerus hayati]|uniref:Uncharacterized protein n=1 Tax=Eretmocerus hayati TaxID=131215 RepID=A0ACC2P6J8_9HYME|nr:hypothetical protein QAD02_014724 [Eretmocerus hayati]